MHHVTKCIVCILMMQLPYQWIGKHARTIIYILGRIACMQCIDVPIATDVARSVLCRLCVCPFVCWAVVWAMHKRLYQSRCRMVCWRMWVHVTVYSIRWNHVIDWIKIPHRKGPFSRGRGMCYRIVMCIHMSTVRLPRATVPVQWMQWTNASPPRGVTRRRCGLLPNYFGQLLTVRSKLSDYYGYLICIYKHGLGYDFCLVLLGRIDRAQCIDVAYCYRCHTSLCLCVGQWDRPKFGFGFGAETDL